MPITIREARASKSDRDWIEETYGEYLADLTAGTTGVFPSLTTTGQSIAEIIQGWFHDDRATAFVVLREQEPIGFAVVQRGFANSDDPKRHYRLSEFFIRNPFRSRGAGRGAAMLLFARYAGEWTIPEQSRNPGAIRFWRRVVAEFTNGQFFRLRLARLQGEADQAQQLAQEGLKISRELQSPNPDILFELGYQALECDDLPEAASYWRKIVQQDIRSLTNFSGENVLEGLALLAARQGKVELAARLFGTRWCRGYFHFLSPPERLVRTATQAELQNLLGKERYTQLSQEGQALTFMQMVAAVREFLELSDES